MRSKGGSTSALEQAGIIDGLTALLPKREEPPKPDRTPKHSPRLSVFASQLFTLLDPNRTVVDAVEVSRGVMHKQGSAVERAHLLQITDKDEAERTLAVNGFGSSVTNTYQAELLVEDTEHNLPTFACKGCRPWLDTSPSIQLRPPTFRRCEVTRLSAPQCSSVT